MAIEIGKDFYSIHSGVRLGRFLKAHDHWVFDIDSKIHAEYWLTIESLQIIVDKLNQLNKGLNPGQ